MTAEPGPPLSVLLIDPRAGASAVVRTMLEASGHRVTFVHDWATAELRLTLQPHEAVVMSVLTPGTRRKSAAALLRGSGGRNGALPLLGLATGVDHLARDKALAEGFDAVLMQPFGAEALEAALRRVVLDRAPPCCWTRRGGPGCARSMAPPRSPRWMRRRWRSPPACCPPSSSTAPRRRRSWPRPRRWPRRWTRSAPFMPPPWRARWRTDRRRAAAPSTPWPRP